MINDEKTQIEKLFDEDDDSNLILYDENNNPTEFQQIAVIPKNNKIYAILKPLSKKFNIADDEALVFVIEEVDDEDYLIIVEDEKIIDSIFDEYYELLKEQI